MPPSTVFLQSGGNLRQKRLTVDVIDAGEGNAVLLTSPLGNSMLVDCGSHRSNHEARDHIKKYITQVMKNNPNGTSITCCVLTHPDEDHTTYFPDIPEAQDPTFVHYSGTIGQYMIHVQDWIKKFENTKGKSVFRYPADGYSDLSPDADFGTETTEESAWVYVLSANKGDDPNSRSIVLLIRYGKRAVILPGDATEITESLILGVAGAKKLLKGCSFLVPGHHGALESTGKDWADATTPQISGISASGKNDGYAHPSCATNTLLLGSASTGALKHVITCSDGKGKPYQPSDTTKALLVTGINGDIRYTTDGEQFKLYASSVGAAPIVPAPVDPTLDAMVNNAPWRRELAMR